MSNNRRNITRFISESADREIAARREWRIFGRVQLYVKDFPPSSVNIQDIIQELEEKIPIQFVSDLDVIYVGQFEQYTEITGYMGARDHAQAVGGSSTTTTTTTNTNNTSMGGDTY